MKSGAFPETEDEISIPGILTEHLEHYLFSVVLDHCPRQLLPTVKLVLHLKEGQSERKRENSQTHQTRH